MIAFLGIARAARCHYVLGLVLTAFAEWYQVVLCWRGHYLVAVEAMIPLAFDYRCPFVGCQCYLLWE